MACDHNPYLHIYYQLPKKMRSLGSSQSALLRDIKATKKLGRDLLKDLPGRHRETRPQTGHCSSHRPNTSASWNKLSTSSSHEQTIQEVYVLFSRWHSFFLRNLCCQHSIIAQIGRNRLWQCYLCLDMLMKLYKTCFCCCYLLRSQGNKNSQNCITPPDLDSKCNFSLKVFGGCRKQTHRNIELGRKYV